MSGLYLPNARYRQNRHHYKVIKGSNNGPPKQPHLYKKHYRPMEYCSYYNFRRSLFSKSMELKIFSSHESYKGRNRYQEHSTE